jgi:hypothetical protein
MWWGPVPLAERSTFTNTSNSRELPSLTIFFFTTTDKPTCLQTEIICLHQMATTSDEMNLKRTASMQKKLEDALDLTTILLQQENFHKSMHATCLHKPS